MAGGNFVMVDGARRGWVLRRALGSALLVAGVLGVLWWVGITAGYLTVEDAGWPYLLIATVLCLFALHMAIGYLQWRRSRRASDDLVAFATALNRGNVRARLRLDHPEENGPARKELNRLADTLEAYVEALQRSSEASEWRARRERAGATAEERHRLAQELHDSVAQQLFALVMLTEAVLAELDAEVPHRPALEEVATLAADAHRELRALITELHPVALQGGSLVDAVEQLVQEQRARADIDIRLCYGPLGEIPPGIEHQVFRVVQEALSNAIRHSGADHVEVQLARSRGALTLRVVDNGCGFDPEEPGTHGYGLTGMRERCVGIGAHLNVRSRPSSGTRIEARVPLLGEGGGGSWSPSG